MYCVRLLVCCLLLCGRVYEARAATTTTTTPSCVEIQGTYSTDKHNEAKQHRCVLCTYIITTHNFCDNLSKSHDSWVTGWKVSKGCVDRNCSDSTEVALSKNSSKNDTSTSKTSCGGNKCKDAANKQNQMNITRLSQNRSSDCCSFSGEADCSEKDMTTKYTSYMLCMGILAAAGNLAVAISTLKRFRQKTDSLSQVQLVHNMMMLNLALSDFMMGVYLCTFGIIKTSCAGRHDPQELCDLRGTSICTVLGIMSFISNQVSVTLLVMMASFRMFSAMFPYKQLSTRTAFFCVLTCWIAWLLIAFLPLINTEWFKLIFVNRIRFEMTSRYNTSLPTYEWMCYRRLRKKILCILDVSAQTCSNKIVLPGTPYWEQLIALAKQFGLYDNETITNFYNAQAWCGMKYFVNVDDYPSSFTLLILSYNFTAFLYIAFAYSFILLKTEIGSCCSFKLGCSPCFSSRCRPLRGKQGKTPIPRCSKRVKENRRMHRLIFAIIVTDFFCWVPMCSAAFWHAGYRPQASKATYKLDIYLKLIVFMLIPVNSVINPFLHSSRVRGMFKKVSKELRSLRSDKNEEAMSLQYM